MGNCCTKKRKPIITPSSSSPTNPTLHSKLPLPATLSIPSFPDPASSYLRFALRFKPLSLTLLPSQPRSTFTLRFDSTDESVSGSPETVLRYVESKLPHPALFSARHGERESVLLERVVELQHQSVRWHLERVATWGNEMATRGGGEVVDCKVGTMRMEVGKLGKCYGMLLEVLLEHAQMEERILFSILQSADPGVCRCVNEEHGRDLPIMNGIKEDMKSIGVMDSGTPTHQEALSSLSARLKTLQDNCRDHFNEEERNLFPLLEAAELTKEQQRKTVEQCVNVMQETHSQFFCFFMEGLLPHEAIEYLDLIMACVNKERVSSMLHLLVD